MESVGLKSGMSLQEKWFIEEKAKLSPSKDRRAKRQYLHFDERITNLTPERARLVWDTTEVAKHPFYPFIRFVKKTARKRRIKGTRKNRTTIKERPIDYAAHFDALIYSWYATLLSEHYERCVREAGIGQCVIAYRSLGERGGKNNNVDFALEVFDFIKKHPDYLVAAFDIKKFYERINHRLLKIVWREVLGVPELPPDHYNVFKGIITSRLVSIETLRKVFKSGGKRTRICTPDEFKSRVVGGGLLQGRTIGLGIPQGSPISCVLSNIYMFPLDKALEDAVERVGGLYRRYSDDIIISVPKEAMNKCVAILEEAVKERDLALNQEKTEKRHFIYDGGHLVSIDSLINVPKPLQYLGMEFDGEEVSLRHAGLGRFQRRAAQAVRGVAIWARKKDRPLPKNTLLKKFTRKGKENYLAYADRARHKANSRAIKAQTAEYKSAKRLKRKIEETTKKLNP